MSKGTKYYIAIFLALISVYIIFAVYQRHNKQSNSQLTCDDFLNHETPFQDAQMYMLQTKSYYLDKDDDGTACEDLPSNKTEIIKIKL